ncbi:MAG: ADP-ribosylglycohydrolase family protein [Suipraeoptans sp.]
MKEKMNMDTRIKLAEKSLRGLSIGDAFGDSFFGDEDVAGNCIYNRTIPAYTKWEFTDDTVMAIAVTNNLKRFHHIDQDGLAAQFAKNYEKDPNRGYGASIHRLLRGLGEGKRWQDLSSEQFYGEGSMGNGAAMRVAPLGCFFYDDYDLLIQEAYKSAEVTHWNIEAKIGADAIAVAAALAINLKLENKHISGEEVILAVASKLEDSDTKSKIAKGVSLPKSYRIETIVSALGNGVRLLSKDTVPIAIWCAAHYLDNYEEALWKAVSALGDRDTICAMVGGIVCLYAENNTIPQKWQEWVEKVEDRDFI